MSELIDMIFNDCGIRPDNEGTLPPSQTKLTSDGFPYSPGLIDRIPPFLISRINELSRVEKIPDEIVGLTGAAYYYLCNAYERVFWTGYHFNSRAQYVSLKVIADILYEIRFGKRTRTIIPWKAFDVLVVAGILHFHINVNHGTVIPADGYVALIDREVAVMMRDKLVEAAHECLFMSCFAGVYYTDSNFMRQALESIHACRPYRNESGWSQQDASRFDVMCGELQQLLIYYKCKMEALDDALDMFWTGEAQPTFVSAEEDTSPCCHSCIVQETTFHAIWDEIIARRGIVNVELQKHGSSTSLPKLALDTLSRTDERSVGWMSHLEVLAGQTTDISRVLPFLFGDVVYIQRHWEEEYCDKVGSEKYSEIRGRFVGFAWHVGHELTIRVLTDHMQKVICRSRHRLAMDHHGEPWYVMEN